MSESRPLHQLLSNIKTEISQQQQPSTAAAEMAAAAAVNNSARLSRLVNGSIVLPRRAAAAVGVGSPTLPPRNNNNNNNQQPRSPSLLPNSIFATTVSRQKRTFSDLTQTSDDGIKTKKVCITPVYQVVQRDKDHHHLDTSRPLPRSIFNKIPRIELDGIVELMQANGFGSCPYWPVVTFSRVYLKYGTEAVVRRYCDITLEQLSLEQEAQSIEEQGTSSNLSGPSSSSNQQQPSFSDLGQAFDPFQPKASYSGASGSNPFGFFPNSGDNNNNIINPNYPHQEPTAASNYRNLFSAEAKKFPGNFKGKRGGKIANRAQRYCAVCKVTTHDNDCCWVQHPHLRKQYREQYREKRGGARGGRFNQPGNAGGMWVRSERIAEENLGNDSRERIKVDVKQLKMEENISD